MLPDHWGALIRIKSWCIESKRHVKWPTANERIVKNAAKESPQLTSAPRMVLATERRRTKWVPLTLTDVKLLTWGGDDCFFFLKNSSLSSHAIRENIPPGDVVEFLFNSSKA